MPFTFSHTLVVLPWLKNKNFSATALVLGAMAPDFEFFFRMRTQSEISHTWHGLFILDFPLALLVAFFFHGILKKTLLLNSPFFIQSRLTTLIQTNWLHYLVANPFRVLLSFLAGAATHFFLDAFTHWDGFFVMRIPFLQQNLLSFPMYEWLQYGSSVVGLIGIAIYFFNIPKDESVVPQIDYKFWWCALLCSLIFLGLRFTLVQGWTKIGDIIVGALSSIILALLVSSVLFKRR